MQEGKKVALIIGANKDIGFEVAHQIPRAGWTVLAAARSEELGWRAVVKLQAEGLDVQYIHIDLDAPESATIAAETTRERFGKLDLLINNAGYSKFAPFEQITDRECKGIIETCFYGVVYTTRAALPVMREQKSGIVFQVSSVGGRITRPGNSACHAAKWAVSGFSEAVAKGDGILRRPDLRAGAGWDSNELGKERGVRNIVHSAGV